MLPPRRRCKLWRRGCHGRRLTTPFGLALALAVPLTAQEGAGGVHVHGFTSVGYALSVDNEYPAEDSTDGTTELWEFALNATWQPADAWRFGAQVFARDFGIYDNGRVQLDWMFAEYRDRDAIWGQVGRVKIPIGLYNEELDVDAARVPAFLPAAVYPRQLRDVFIAIDGARVGGFVDFDGAGAIEYAVYGGVKHIDEESGTATSLSGIGGAGGAGGLGDDLEIEPSPVTGAMLHWHTPLQGLGLRVSAVSLYDFEVDGRQPGPIAGSTVTSTLEVDEYPLVVISAEYETGDWLFAGEYARYFADGTVTSRIDLPVPDQERDFEDDTEGWYLSATWSGFDRLALYAALDWQTDDPGDYGDAGNTHKAVTVAARYDLRDNWLVKGEVSRIDGHALVISGPDGDPPEDDWWFFALKTTVDF